MVLLLVPASNQPGLEVLRKLKHEYSLRGKLESAWAVRPIEFLEQSGRPTLVLEDPGGETLDQSLPGPMELTRFLRLAIRLTVALAGLHKKGLIHKDIKPANVLVNPATDEIRLMGFGIASRLMRERQVPEPPEFIVGTLAYMAPEQTGRMNRSVDSRSDLYALGVMLYEMLTGTLPFSVTDAMELVHCHIARMPVSPADRMPGIPRQVSAIVMKLLAKTAEERYQTAAGAAGDLRRCLDEWGTRGSIDEFPLGEQDVPDRLVIPEKLYGRESETEVLLAAFDRIVAGGRPELVLVSGYSGVGKSSVVNELHKSLVPPRGLFAAGKFDQYKRDVPYVTLAQAFQSLLLPLLTKDESELSKWRDALREAVDSNGQLIVDLVPALRFIIGEQPPVPEVSPQDAQARFQLVFARFIGVFARQEHPLALFLDDLQWLDTATLDLIAHLVTQSDVRHLMLIGAYRDNEVSPTHPLMRKLEAIRQASAIVQNIILEPLTRENLAQQIADSVHSEPDRVAPLAELVHEKTGGNPFFAIQFLSELADEGLITFDHGEGRWTWDLNRIRAKNYTDNVVDLMVGKLNRMPAGAQNALKQLACLGNRADFGMLKMVYSDSGAEIESQLWESVMAGLVFRSDDSYRFLHDRVQEAAYSLIGAEARSEAHLRIGRLLLAQTPPEKIQEAIFEIVNQLNRASDLITSAAHRGQLAELNLVAAKRAKRSAAFASALSYLTVARGFLSETTWGDNYDLTFSIESLLAECELLTGNLVRSEDRLSELAQRALTRHDLAVITRLRLTVYTALDRSDRGVEICLEYLKRDGNTWPLHPTINEVRNEYERIWAQVGSREIEDFLDLPVMTDAEVLDAMDVLAEVVTPAVFFDEKLSSFLLCRMVLLSLEHGNTDASSFAYVWFAVVARSGFGNYKDAFRFGRLGYELIEKRGLRGYEARTLMSFGNLVIPTAKHALEGRDMVRRAFDAAYRNGDLTFAAYSCNQLITNMLVVGDPLTETLAEGEKGLAFAQKTGFGLVVDLLTAQVQLVRTLRGLTPKFECFNDEHFDELKFEQHLASNPVLADPEFGYWALKVQARFLAMDYDSAIHATSKAQPLLWSAPSLFEPSSFRFYAGLSHAAAWDLASSEEKQEHFEALEAHHKQLEIWAEHSPANFESRVALTGAEIARIEGRLLDAEGLYEKAIRSANANGFIHNEAVAYEVASRFYLARGFDKIADAYLRESRYCYLRWGADGKVRQLDQLYPHLSNQEPARGRASTIVERGEHLDLATVIEVSQAVSGELVLERLIERVMRAAIEHAGAERGLVIFPQGDELQVKAEAATRGNDVAVYVRGPAETRDVFPQSVVRYVARTRKDVILDDATVENPFSADPYIVRHRARSIVCLPLANQGRLNGILYLENNLTPYVFTSDRITVLKVLASQAAISLENTRLYRDLEDREAKIRRLVDANILGVTTWNVEGAILASNEAFLRMVQYDHEDVAAGRVRWRDMTPADCREHVERALAEVMHTGSVQPFESELFRKDGSRLPVLLAGALFEEGGNEGVAFALDLSEQKRADEALRRSEGYLAQAQRLAQVGSWAWKAPSRNALYISEQWYRIFGFDPKDGMPTWEQRSQRVHPEDRARWQATIDRAIAEKSDYEVEFRILPPHSTVKYIHSVGHPVLDSSGELLQFVGISMDVTERKRAEEALRSSEAYLTEAQRLTHTGSCAIDSKSREILYWSDEMFRLFGFDPQQGLPMWDQWLQRIHPEDREKFRMAGDRTFLEKVPCDVEFRTLKPDGTVKHIHGIGHPVLSPSGELVQVVGTMMDITERRRAEAALRRSQAYLAESQRLTHTGSWASHGTTHEAKYWSEEMFRVFGFDPEQGLPMREQWLQRIHPEDRDKVKRQASERMFLQKLDSDLEFRIVLPDGTVKHIHGLAHPVFTSNGELVEVVGTAIDITERKHAENERERLQQLEANLAHINRVTTMGELTASLAHEINQPIGAAMTNAQACLRFLNCGQLDLPEAREAAQEMVKDARRAADIIDRVRSLYRKGSAHQEIVDVNEVIREMVVMFQKEANRYSVDMRAELCENLPSVVADRVQLQQVLMNLMKNGIEAMRDAGMGGELSIKSQLAEDGQLLISVSDTGVGLPIGKGTEIFNAFFTTKSQGTGVGLAITRSIVESHGGRVWATENSGRGTTFQFTLPKKTAAHA